MECEIQFCARMTTRCPASWLCGIMMDGGFPLANAHLTFGWSASENSLVKNQRIPIQVHSTELQNKTRRLWVFQCEGFLEEERREWRSSWKTHALKARQAALAQSALCLPHRPPCVPSRARPTKLPKLCCCIARRVYELSIWNASVSLSFPLSECGFNALVGIRLGIS